MSNCKSQENKVTALADNGNDETISYFRCWSIHNCMNCFGFCNAFLHVHVFKVSIALINSRTLSLTHQYLHSHQSEAYISPPFSTHFHLQNKQQNHVTFLTWSLFHDATISAAAFLQTLSKGPRPFDSVWLPSQSVGPTFVICMLSLSVWV